MKKGGLLGNAFRLGLLSLLSSILGFAREILIVRRFGASPATDAYIAAYSLPLMFFALTFGAGLALALVPQLAGSDERTANGRFGQFLSFAALPGAAVSILIIVFRGSLIHFFTPGLRDPGSGADFLIALAPVYYLTLVATAFGTWQCARNATHVFGAIAVIQNAVLVAGIASFGSLGIQSLIWFTLAGHLASFAFQLTMAKRAEFREPFTMPRRDSGGMRLFFALLPFMLTLGIGGDSGTAQGEVILARYFGSMLEAGSITLLALGNKLAGMPAVLVGAALGTALLPAATRAAKDADPVALAARVRLAITTAVLLTAPLVVVYIDAPGVIVSVLLAGRSLRPDQIAALSSILRAYAPAIAGWTLVFVLGNALAAMGDTVFLVVSGVVAIVAGAVMMKFFSAWYGAPGIALSVSFCSLFYSAQMAIRMIRTFRSEHGQGGFVRPVVIVTAGAVGMHFLIAATQGMVPLLAVVPVVLVLYLGWSLWNRDRLHLREAFTT